jgi:hypothetical protein
LQETIEKTDQDFYYTKEMKRYGVTGGIKDIFRSLLSSMQGTTRTGP